MVTFSVIIPFYKGNQYIEKLFRIVEDNERVLRQVFPESTVEMILVNDSPEEEILLPESAERIPCKIISHNENKGIHQSRVTGLLESKGDYILFLDQDDEVAEEFLAEQFQKIDDVDVIVSGAFFEKPDGTLKKYYDKPGKLEKLTDLNTYLKAHNQIISPGQCLIRKASIPVEWTKNIMRINGSDDLFLWILMFEKNCRFRVNPNCLYTHKYTGVNLSESGEKMTLSSLDFADYLKSVPYVSKKHIRAFERCRTLDIDMGKVNGLRKIGPIVRNADIILHRVWWKIKCL